jgi:ATP-dependent Zn protease
MTAHKRRTSEEKAKCRKPQRYTRTWKGRTVAELRRAAYHEAGHAVAHRVVGMVCGEASIVPDYKTMSCGFAVAADPWVVYSAWARRGKLRGFHIESILRGRIIGYMAGREAEIIAFGTRHEIGDGDDRLQIAMMAKEAGISETTLGRLRSKVGPLLRRHWRKAERVAESLLIRKTLSGPEIDALIRNATTPHERAITKRIEAARKADREMMAWQFRESDEPQP